MKGWAALGALWLAACATAPQAAPGAPVADGVLRERPRPCFAEHQAGPATVLSRPAGARRFRLERERAGGAPGGELSTNEAGGFRLALEPGRWCLVDVDGPGGDCAGWLTSNPKAEPTPVGFVQGPPCPDAP